MGTILASRKFHLLFSHVVLPYCLPYPAKYLSAIVTVPSSSSLIATVCHEAIQGTRIILFFAIVSQSPSGKWIITLCGNLLYNPEINLFIQLIFSVPFCFSFLILPNSSCSPYASLRSNHANYRTSRQFSSEHRSQSECRFAPEIALSLIQHND